MQKTIMTYKVTNDQDRTLKDARAFARSVWVGNYEAASASSYSDSERRDI